LNVADLSYQCFSWAIWFLLLFVSSWWSLDCKFAAILDTLWILL